MSVSSTSRSREVGEEGRDGEEEGEGGEEVRGEEEQVEDGEDEDDEDEDEEDGCFVLCCKVRVTPSSMTRAFPLCVANATSREKYDGRGELRWRGRTACDCWTMAFSTRIASAERPPREERMKGMNSCPASLASGPCLITLAEAL